MNTHGEPDSEESAERSKHVHCDQHRFVRFRISGVHQNVGHDSDVREYESDKLDRSQKTPELSANAWSVLQGKPESRSAKSCDRSTQLPSPWLAVSIIPSVVVCKSKCEDDGIQYANDNGEREL